MVRGVKRIAPFGYYSGPGNRLQLHFSKHQKNFYSALISTERKPQKLPLRPFFYVQPLHGQFALLSFFGYNDPAALQLLRDELGIEALTSVLFVIRQPGWGRTNKTDLFWGARGTVRGFLDKLYSIALAPLRLRQTIPIGFRNKETLDFRYLYLDLENNYLEDNHANLLEDLAKDYGRPQDFFKVLESTYISELLYEVRCTVKIRGVDGRISFRELSEGEQQLLMVLGLMRFTQEDESLFLLDEPDTHLNPIWSIQYLKFIERLVGKLDKSHIIMATHDPLVFAGLLKSEVRIMQLEKIEKDGRIFEQVVARQPDEDPKGMGVAAILTSDLFRLRSTLDEETQELWEKRRLLAAKAGPLTQEESQRLEELDRDLPRMSLQHPLFDRFLEAWEKEKKSQWPERPDLTPEQLEEQRKLAAKIVKDLMEKKVK